MMERRAVLRALSAGVIGSVGGARPGFATDPPPDTTKITMVRIKGICLSPQ